MAIATIVELGGFVRSFFFVLALWQRRTDFGQTADEKSAFDSVCQVFGAPATPVMKEHYARLFVGHVLVNGHDVDFVFKQRF
jgi:hypothetical protein